MRIFDSSAVLILMGITSSVVAGESESLRQEGRVERKAKPNVIVIMTDDQGYPELSMHGNPILKTPNLDKLAQTSVRLGDFHASPMCAPTRGNY